MMFTGVEMDIKKKREAFEKLPDIKGILHGSDFGFNESINQYYHPDHTNHRLSYAFIMGAWMAWITKAQVPKGFVLVPKKPDVDKAWSIALKRIVPPPKTNDAVQKELMCKKYVDDLYSEQDRILLDYEAMIEAQKQKVTEMKINWGMECPRCNHNEAIIHSTAGKDSGYEFMNGDAVNCLKCGNIGEMDANGEDSDIVWNEDEAQEQSHD